VAYGICITRGKPGGGGTPFEPLAAQKERLKREKEARREALRMKGRALDEEARERRRQERREIKRQIDQAWRDRHLTAG
jgi:hypothetical protein